jgi:peptide/nickel transport system substrate-binding protein
LSFFRGSWIADYPDAENYLSLFYSKNFSPNGPNYTHFKNSEFDNLYENSLFQINDSIRFALYNKMDEIILDNAAIVPLYYDEVLRFTQKNIFGMSNNPANMLSLKYVNKVLVNH